MQGNDDNRASDRMKATYDRHAGRVTKRGSITQFRLNKSKSTSNRHGVTHTG
jgi:hypothetical protein